MLEMDQQSADGGFVIAIVLVICIILRVGCALMVDEGFPALEEHIETERENARKRLVELRDNLKLQRRTKKLIK